MANVLTDLSQTYIMPQALQVLRENCVMPALINQDYKNEAAQRNQTIRVQLPQDMSTANDFNPAAGSSSTDLDDPYVDITLSNWKYKQFEMSDKEMFDSVSNGVIPSAMDAAIKSIANAIDLSILNLYKEFKYWYGVPGTTPDESADIIGVRQKLQENLAPQGDRRLVMDTNAEAKFLDLYEKANETGTTEALRNASLGRLFGLDTYIDQLIPKHTSGTLTAANDIAAKAIYAIGTTAITLDDSGGGALTETLVQGDKITFAGDSTIYTVTADATAAANEIAITIFPGLAVATADGTVATVSDSGWVPNLCFHRDAMCLAMRPLQDADEMTSESSTIVVQTDPVSGIPLRMETWRSPSYSTRYWKFDVLYGVKLLRPELCAILFG